ncbi:MAG: hypothetical protein Q9217_003906 [Psora testacea]
MADTPSRSISRGRALPCLEPVRLVASAPSRPHTLRSTTSSSNQYNVCRVFSAQHLDDGSVYHGHDNDREDRGLSPSDESGDLSEQALSEAECKSGSDEVDEHEIRDEKDIEAPLEKKRTTRSIKDPNLVGRIDDPENPKNWTTRRKWAATLVVSSFTFISPVSSSMVAPALATIAKDFGITNEVESQLVLSIFVLAYAIGPLFLGPLSEMYGRVPVLQLANLFYLIFNIAGGFAQNKAEMIAFRFLSGLGGSAPLVEASSVTAGARTSAAEQSPWGFITQNTSWRWAFYATSIADAIIQVSGLFLLRETYPPKLLHRKAEKLRTKTGNKALKTEFEHPERSFSSTMERSLIRPFKLLGTQPIIQVLACYMAYLYGIMYLVLSTYPVLWTTKYHESIGVGGLNYISLGVGFFLGTQISAPLNDGIYRRLRKRNNGVGQPEFRVPMMIPGSLLVPAGLFIYGWTAQYHVHWIGPNIGAAIFSAGMIIGFQCIQTYLVDAYTRYAASAVGAATVLRSMAGFGFPLFAPSMYKALDYGWGNSLLRFIAIGLGIPAPVLLWIYGKKLREKSPFAAGGGT